VITIKRYACEVTWPDPKTGKQLTETFEDIVLISFEDPGCTLVLEDKEIKFPDDAGFYPYLMKEE